METIYTKAHRRLVKALKDARVNAGLTQVEVAERLGKPQPALSQLESGNRRIDVVELAQLCNLYKVDMLELLADLKLQQSVRLPRRDR